MNDKCHWNDGQFVPCERVRVYVSSGANFVVGHFMKHDLNIEYCPFCGELLKQPTPETWEPGDGYKYEKTRILDQRCGVITNGVCHRCPISYQCGIIENSKPWYVWKRLPTEPLIVKSGGTFAATVDGVNLLCINPEFYRDMQISQSIPEEKLTDYVSVDDMELCDKIWKPFTEITLTDEIAKLRPLVMAMDSLGMECGLKTLYGIEARQGMNEDNYITNTGRYRYARLATPKEIQEAME